MIFNNETELQFSGKFLSITISTNKVVFTAIHTIKVRSTHDIVLYIVSTRMRESKVRCIS